MVNPINAATYVDQIRQQVDQLDKPERTIFDNAILSNDFHSDSELVNEILNQLTPQQYEQVEGIAKKLFQFRRDLTREALRPLFPPHSPALNLIEEKNLYSKIAILEYDKDFVEAGLLHPLEKPINCGFSYINYLYYLQGTEGDLLGIVVDQEDLEGNFILTKSSGKEYQDKITDLTIVEALLRGQEVDLGPFKFKLNLN